VIFLISRTFVFPLARNFQIGHADFMLASVGFSFAYGPPALIYGGGGPLFGTSAYGTSIFGTSIFAVRSAWACIQFCAKAYQSSTALTLTKPRTRT
jgi:hypothetical protein